jgi:hypothetical protein
VDLAAFDALVLLKEESLPQHAFALSTSPLHRWAQSSPALGVTAVTELLEGELPQHSQSLAILSHIPRCVPFFSFSSSSCSLSNLDDGMQSNMLI